MLVAARDTVLWDMWQGHLYASPPNEETEARKGLRPVPEEIRAGPQSLCLPSTRGPDFTNQENSKIIIRGKQMQVRHLFIWPRQKHFSKAQKTEVSLSQHFIQGTNMVTHTHTQMTSEEGPAAPSR